MLSNIVDKNIVDKNIVDKNIVDKNIVDILNRYENFEGIQNPNVGHSKIGFTRSSCRILHILKRPRSITNLQKIGDFS